MNCEYELEFLLDILKKCRIRSFILSPSDTADTIIDTWINSIIGVDKNAALSIEDVMGKIESNTRYRFTNDLNLHYIILRMPIQSEKNILVIGPYLTSVISNNEALRVSERLGLSPNMKYNLTEYYASVPVILENDHIFVAIDTFCERLWQGKSFPIVEINNKHRLTITPKASTYGDDCNEILANMERLEARYRFENELLQAVTLGQIHKEKHLLNAISNEVLEKRSEDTVRNGKNYCIIMNTLLRKAAESGGVHPIYIDRMSSSFASKIELITDTKEISGIMREMFTSYCKLVQKHSIKKYSPVVQKSILMIDSDISAELSLRTIAKKQGITPEYLATVFKKETGKTLSEYLRDKRVQYAIHLLGTTNLQVQTIATHCGIVDVQYFSKMFKKQTGKTPNEFRKNLKNKS